MRERLASASITAPTTVRKTPVSKAIALANSNSPTSGRWKWPKVEVRKGWSSTIAPMPVAAATSTPRPIMAW